MYAFKGSYNSGIRYVVGDVVTYIDDKAYHLQKDAGGAGVPPTDTLYWGQLDSDTSEMCFMLGQVLDKLTAEISTTDENVDDLTTDVTALTTDVTALTTDVTALTTDVTALTTDVTALQAQVGEKAIILSSSTEGSKKQFLITVDDTGELLATEIVPPEPEDPGEDPGEDPEGGDA